MCMCLKNEGKRERNEGWEKMVQKWTTTNENFVRHQLFVLYRVFKFRRSRASASYHRECLISELSLSSFFSAARKKSLVGCWRIQLFLLREIKLGPVSVETRRLKAREIFKTKLTKLYIFFLECRKLDYEVMRLLPNINFKEELPIFEINPSFGLNLYKSAFRFSKIENLYLRYYFLAGSWILALICSLMSSLVICSWIDIFIQ